MLNIESRSATFRYCDLHTKYALGQHLLKCYPQWMKEKEFRPLTPRDLFLVTGTYMTTNWEAAILSDSSEAINAGVSIEALQIAGKFSVDWARSIQTLKAYQSGHNHPGSPPDPLPELSFDNACHCEKHSRTQDQCIFLRGWQVRELFKFPTHVFAAPISVEHVKSVEWRRSQFYGRTLRSLPKKTDPMKEGKKRKRSFFRKLTCSLGASESASEAEVSERVDQNFVSLFKFSFYLSYNRCYATAG